jgi:hypothetical protein
MPSIPRQLATFALVLAVLYAAGFVAGQFIETGHGKEMSGGHGGGHATAAAAVRGLAVAENGLRLVVDDTELRRGGAEDVRFRIVDSGGRPVRDFEVEHERRLHMIVASRDLGSFQHLHPRMAPDGTWSTPVRLDRAGTYRLFADFVHGGRATTLATDLRVDGTADLRALPAAATVARSDLGATVRRTGDAPKAGHAAQLGFEVSRGGEPVDLEPYLGADGHLVALREGDLAFLHVHPVDGMRFEATFPTPGRYRLFLQFQEAGRVHTVAFTQLVG